MQITEDCKLPRLTSVVSVNSKWSINHWVYLCRAFTSGSTGSPQVGSTGSPQVGSTGCFALHLRATFVFNTYSRLSHYD